MTPWTAGCQASLAITNSWNLPKLMSIELVMPSSYLILCCPLLLLPSIFPSIRVFPMSQLFASGGQNIGASASASASASVLPMSVQGWFLLELTGLVSLMSKGLSRVFFSTTIWKNQFFRKDFTFFLQTRTKSSSRTLFSPEHKPQTQWVFIFFKLQRFLLREQFHPFVSNQIQMQITMQTNASTLFS